MDPFLHGTLALLGVFLFSAAVYGLITWARDWLIKKTLPKS